MPHLGITAPEFNLPDVTGRRVTLDDFGKNPALLVAFWCNHCPYVQHLRDGFAGFVRDYQPQGLAVVAISSNDVSTHPDDSPEMMRVEAERYDFSFAYLYDETQDVAQAYEAACTPDFFLYDDKRRLVYRGQFDDSRPGNDTQVSGSDLRCAVDAVLAGKPVSPDQRPSIGCNIKWKSGNEPPHHIDR